MRRALTREPEKLSFLIGLNYLNRRSCSGLIKASLIKFLYPKT